MNKMMGKTIKIVFVIAGALIFFGAGYYLGTTLEKKNTDRAISANKDLTKILGIVPLGTPNFVSVHGDITGLSDKTINIVYGPSQKRLSVSVADDAKIYLSIADAVNKTKSTFDKLKVGDIVDIYFGLGQNDEIQAKNILVNNSNKI